jgi:hypothetical protein
VTIEGYTIRRLRPEDAAGVRDCVMRVYGDSYLHREMYEPDELIRMNETGQRVSVVALDAVGKVVGHYALERDDLGPIAEEGEAFVAPEHRHRNLMDEMHDLLEQEANRLGLKGLYGQAVTNHVFSQKVHERFGLAPCAITLGSTPRSFHNLPETEPQRLSLLIGFKFLGAPTPSVVHVPARHRPIVEQIYTALKVPVKWREGVASSYDEEVSFEASLPLQSGSINVGRVGKLFAERLHRAVRELLYVHKVEAMFLDLPLADPGTPDACTAAENDGFFFAGVCPQFSPTGDVLRLQRLNVDLDTSRLQLDTPFARRLLQYIEHERKRSQASKAQ